MADGNGRLAGEAAIVTAASPRAGGMSDGRAVVGNGVRCLMSDAARRVTGIVVPVDAGASAALSAYPARRGDNAER